MSESTAQSETKHACGACGCSGAGPAFTDFLRGMMPPGAAVEHFDQARISFLKGLRALIDARIDDLSRKEHKGTRINVE